MGCSTLTRVAEWDILGDYCPVCGNSIRFGLPTPPQGARDLDSAPTNEYSEEQQ